jgi:hypothetical protein
MILIEAGPEDTKPKSLQQGGASGRSFHFHVVVTTHKRSKKKCVRRPTVGREIVLVKGFYSPQAHDADPNNLLRWRLGLVGRSIPTGIRFLSTSIDPY